MSNEIQQLIHVLKNTNKSKEIDKNELQVLESISDENSLNEFINKTPKEEFKILTKSLLNCSGIKTYLRKKGDNSFRMDALGTYKNSYIAFEFENILDLDGLRNTVENLAVLLSRYNLSTKITKGVIVTTKIPSSRSDVWELFSDINSVLGVEIYVIPFYALLEIVNKNHKIDLELFHSLKNKKSFRKSLEKNIGKKIGLKKPNPFLESPK